MKNLTVGMFLLASSLITACATDPSGPVAGEDELGAESGDGESSKADGVDNFNFLEVHQVKRVGTVACAGGSCSYLKLARANRTMTTCADGSTAATCTAQSLDFSSLGLGKDSQDIVLAALQKEARDPEQGTQVLVRGRYVHTPNVQAPNGDLVTFAPSEVWVAQIDGGTTEGTFVRVAFNGRRCAVAPCPSTTEGKLNSVKSQVIDAVHFDASTDETVVDTAKEAISGSEGALVVGLREFGGTETRKTTLRSANQVYLRVE